MQHLEGQANEGDGLAAAECSGTDACDAARDRMLTTILTAHGYLPAEFTFDDVAEAYVRANEAVAGGADGGDIEAAFAASGFNAAAGAANPPSTSFYISHAQEEDLEVTVDVIDPTGTTLCETIEIGPPAT